MRDLITNIPFVFMRVLHPTAVGIGIGKSAKRRRCHVADATSDTVKPLEMETLRNYEQKGKGRGRGGGRVFTGT